MSDVIAAEEGDLKTHVQLCGQRHAAIEKRLTRMERAIWALIILVSSVSGIGFKELAPIARGLAGH